jgi:hypothetical protein
VDTLRIPKNSPRHCDLAAPVASPFDRRKLGRSFQMLSIELVSRVWADIAAARMACSDAGSEVSTAVKLEV